MERARQTTIPAATVEPFPVGAPAGSAVWPSVLKVAAATAAFALVHSFFSSRPAKRAAARLLGERGRCGLYRPFFMAQTALTLGALWAYVRPLPDRELYRIPGNWRWITCAAQAVTVGYALHAAWLIGFSHFSGLANLRAWLRGDETIPEEPEAQGPALRPDGTVRTEGPFRWSRHPLDLAPVLVLWLMPRMTVKLAAFNGVTTLYFYLGAFHEEARLRVAYGEAYAAYQQSGCPFFVPSLNTQTQSLPPKPLREGDPVEVRPDPR